MKARKLKTIVIIEIGLIIVFVIFYWIIACSTTSEGGGAVKGGLMRIYSAFYLEDHVFYLFYTTS